MLPMKAGTLLRIGLYLVAIWALFTAATAGAFQLLYFIVNYENGVGFFLQQMMPSVATYLVCPLAFAVVLFATAGRVERFLLGAKAEEVVCAAPPASRGLLTAALQVLGVYILVIYGAALVATVFELFALRVRNEELAQTKAVSDLIANVVGVGAGCVLTLRTERILARLWAPGATVPDSSIE
jgi:hypothetical protein